MPSLRCLSARVSAPSPETAAPPHLRSTMTAAYPVRSRAAEKHRERPAPEILRLTDELPQK